MYAERVAADGEIVAIGARENSGESGFQSGHVRVFAYDGSRWTQMGGDIDGESEGDKPGGDVSISSDGTIVAIEAEYNTENGGWSGHVRVFAYDESQWKSVDLNGWGY